MKITAKESIMDTAFKSPKQVILYTGKRFKPDFNLDDPERYLMYRKVFHCLSGSNLAQELGIDPTRGILQIGSKGVGKSILMRVMQVIFKNTERRFKWVDVFLIRDLLKSKEVTELEIKDLYGKGLKCDLYIDDIGFGKDNLKLWANEVNIIAEILYERDELFVMEGFRTHLSSNVPTTVAKDAPQDEMSIERILGDRVLDRIKQMDNLLTWKSKQSLRVK